MDQQFQERVMSEVFLVYLSETDTARKLLWAAATMAANIEHVHFEVMAVRVPPQATIMPTEQVISWEDCERIRSEEAYRADQLHEIHDRWVGQILEAGHHSEWIDLEGLAAKEILQRGCRADLIVVDRIPEVVNQIARNVLNAALFDCHRPVLIVPPGLYIGPDATLGRHVAIAWKDDGRAIKAVIPAMRYFSHAVDITVLAGYRGSRAPTALPEPLAEREVDARLCPMAITSDPFGRTLLERAQGLGADVLVMGAYSHSPLREMIFGGVTRHILHHAELPVLMRH
jgi:hypothetical protein